MLFGEDIAKASQSVDVKVMCEGRWIMHSCLLAFDEEMTGLIALEEMPIPDLGHVTSPRRKWKLTLTVIRRNLAIYCHLRMECFSFLFLFFFLQWLH